MGKIIELDKSVIPACDVDTIYQLERIVGNTKDVKYIKAYKIGFNLVFAHGLPAVVEAVKDIRSDAVVIYDHQKGGTDIPDMGKKFANRMKEAGVDAAILFPMAGPETQKAWTEALLEKDIGVLIGGEMTHKGYKHVDGGYIHDEAPEEMYVNGAECGVTDFVVPGNKPEVIELFRDILINECGIDPVFYAPGFVAQLGKITDAAKVAGDRWHAIAGRGIYNPNKKENLDDVTSEEITNAAKELTSQLYV